MAGQSDPTFGRSGLEVKQHDPATRASTGRSVEDSSTVGPKPIHSLIVIVVGLIAGFAYAGWSFSGDLLLNWDQVVGQRIPVPPGFYGEGPELPRRMPLYVLLAAMSRVIPGPALVGLLFVGSTVGAVAGVHRRAGSDFAGLVVAVGYGLSPFIVTRASVGHLPVVVAVALVPWALEAFESGERRRIFLWATAFGLTGPSGAVIGLVPAALAIIWPTGSRRSNPWPRRLGDLALLIVSQFSWLIPGIVVLTGEGSFPSSPTSAFATRTEGIAGVLRLAAGGGFFIGPEDVANRAGLIAAGLGLVVVSGGVVGLVERNRFDLMAKSTIAATVMVLASIEGIGAVGWQQLTGVGPFGVARDAQKFWPLIGLGLAVGLAHVLRRITVRTPRVISIAALSAVVVLQLGSVWPGLLGANGRLVAADSPLPWLAIEDSLAPRSSSGRAVEVQSQTLTVALPWVRYERLELSGNRNVLQPAPWLLPSPVLVSGDPGLGAGNSERSDPVGNQMPTLDLAVRSGAAIAPELRKLGVTHVLITGSSDAELYRRIGNEAGVEVLVQDGNFALYQMGAQTTIESGSFASTRQKSGFQTFVAGGPMILLSVFIAFGTIRAIASNVRQVGDERHNN